MYKLFDTEIKSIFEEESVKAKYVILNIAYCC